MREDYVHQAAPNDTEIWLLQMLEATAGSPANFRRWIQIARGRLGKKDHGKPKKTDTHWLLCAEALQRHDPALSKTAAIEKTVEMFWSVHYAANKGAFRDRLLDAVRNKSLRKFAQRLARKHGLRVDYDPSSGFGFTGSE